MLRRARRLRPLPFLPVMISPDNSDSNLRSSQHVAGAAFMPAGQFELGLCALGSAFTAASVYFYRAKQTLPFKARTESFLALASGVRPCLHMLSMHVANCTAARCSTRLPRILLCFFLQTPKPRCTSFKAMLATYGALVQVSYAVAVPVLGSSIIMLAQPRVEFQVRTCVHLAQQRVHCLRHTARYCTKAGMHGALVAASPSKGHLLCSSFQARAALLWQHALHLQRFRILRCSSELCCHHPTAGAATQDQKTRNQGGNPLQEQAERKFDGLLGMPGHLKSGSQAAATVQRLNDSLGSSQSEQ